MDERFLVSAGRFWWAHVIAYEYHLDPREVKKWQAEDIMETLAAINMRERAQKKQMNAAKKG